MANKVLRHLLLLATMAILAACGSGGGDDSGNAGASPSANPPPAQPAVQPPTQPAAQPPAQPAAQPPAQPAAQPPAQPAPQSTASLALQWTANTEPDLAGYKIYRATSSGGYGAAIATVPANATAYVVTGLQPGVTYFFVISAYDTAGNESTRSAEVSASL